MIEYKKYTFALCLIVFIMLFFFTLFMILALMKMSKRLIDSGADDEGIYDEYSKKKEKHKKGYTLNVLFSFLFCCVFALALVMNFQTSSPFKKIPTLRVVESASMATKFSTNEYLEENELHDQFDVYDIVLTYKLPNEFDLQLYDIVVYEVEGYLLIHRIVGIEEPNANHPEHRHFLLQGDAVENPDRFPVLYEQMRGIYRGQHIRFVGSFIIFLQSFAGWLCMALMLFALTFAPVLDNHLEKKRKERYLLLVQSLQSQSYQNTWGYPYYYWYGGY